MTNVRQGLPVDDRQTDDQAGDGGSVRGVSRIAAALRARILADPAGRVAHERAREEIERHQASLAKVRKLRALAQATVVRR